MTTPYKVIFTGEVSPDRAERVDTFFPNAQVGDVFTVVNEIQHLYEAVQVITKGQEVYPFWLPAACFNRMRTFPADEILDIMARIEADETDGWTAWARLASLLNGEKDVND